MLRVAARCGKQARRHACCNLLHPLDVLLYQSLMATEIAVHRALLKPHCCQMTEGSNGHRSIIIVDILLRRLGRAANDRAKVAVRHDSAGSPWLEAMRRCAVALSSHVGEAGSHEYTGCTIRPSGIVRGEPCCGSIRRRLRLGEADLSKVGIDPHRLNRSVAAGGSARK